MLEKFKSKNNRKMLWFVIGFLLLNVIIILTTLLVVSGVPSIHKNGKNVIAWSSNAWSNAGDYLINQIYLNNFFKQPPLVLGFLTLIGYLIMNRGWKDSVLGALKTTIGFVLLTIGSGTIVGISKVVFGEIKNIGGSNIVPLDPYFGWASADSFFKNFYAVNDYLSLITYVFVLAFAVNIILVSLKRWTNVHSLMITGHVMFQQAAIITTAFYVILFRAVPLLNGGQIPIGAQAGLVIITALFLGAYWGIGSSATYKPTNVITENSGFAIGHQQMLGIALIYNISKKLGNKEDSTETRKMPKWLKIFEDNVFVQTLIITILFFILIMILIGTKPNSYIENGKFIGGLAPWNDTFKDAHWIINVFGGSIKIVAGLLALITGVRMFVTELQQSFQGISEKLIPGAVVAIDIAAVYGFAPNSVTFGFVSGTIGQFLGVGIVIGISAIMASLGNKNAITIVIPLFVTLFFSSGAMGPYANAAGGIKATLIAPAILGLLEIIIISFALSALTHASKEISEVGIQIPDTKNEWFSNPFQTGYIGMADWNLFFGFVMLISGYFSVMGYIFIPLALMGLLFYGLALDSGKQKSKTWVQKMLKLNPVLEQIEQSN